MVRSFYQEEKTFNFHKFVYLQKIFHDDIRSDGLCSNGVFDYSYWITNKSALHRVHANHGNRHFLENIQGNREQNRIEQISRGVPTAVAKTPSAVQI